MNTETGRWGFGSLCFVKTFAAAIALVLAGGGAVARADDPAAAAAAAAPAKLPAKVMMIILENTDRSAALAQPFLDAFARGGALLENSFGVARPSQPNYLALVAGDTLGVHSNRNVDLDAKHLGDLVEAAGKDWRVYADGYPGGCFRGASQGRYARKHQPFMSFRNVTTDPARCARITDSSSLATDLASGKLADFSLVVPDLDNDGHDTGVDYADRWLERTFGAMIRENRLPAGLTLVVTFDEGDYFHSNRIYTAFHGAAVKPGAVHHDRADHYTVLRAVEHLLGLPNLGRNDATASDLADIWKN